MITDIEMLAATVAAREEFLNTVVPNAFDLMQARGKIVRSERRTYGDHAFRELLDFGEFNFTLETGLFHYCNGNSLRISPQKSASFLLVCWSSAFVVEECTVEGCLTAEQQEKLSALCRSWKQLAAELDRREEEVRAHQTEEERKKHDEEKLREKARRLGIPN